MVPDRASSFKTATEAVTLVLATAGLVYVLGGLVLALRLWFAGLPVQGTVAQLPKELVITVGLSEVITPAFIVGLLAVIALLVSPRPLRKNSLSRSPHVSRVWVVTIAATFAMLVPGTVRALASYEPSIKWLSYLVAIVVAVVAAVAARMIINDVLSSAGFETAAASSNLGEGYLKPVPLLKIGSTIAALAAVGSLIFVGGRELVPVSICPREGGPPISGHLIGQSSDNAYIALGVDYKKVDPQTKSSPYPQTKDEAVLSIGNARVNRLLYGRGAAAKADQSCPS